MNTEILGAAGTLLLAFLLALPLGRYIALAVDGQRTVADRLFGPLDNLLYRIGGIAPEREMTWSQHLAALLTINALWLVMSMLVLMNMAWLPLNPDQNPSMSADLAFNTSVSFVTNTNLQHYSGETGLSYLGQLTLMLWQFISAGTGIAICVVVFRAMRSKESPALGNFYVLLVRSCTRILLPLAVGLAVLLAFQGTPMTMKGKAVSTTLEGERQEISRGPVAAMVAIKQLGTNGGGYYGPNSTNPMENPTYLSNMAENAAILLIPMAMIFAMGHLLRRRRLAWMLFGVMAAGLLALLIPAVILEMKGNPSITNMGIAQPLGSMEGKEVRFGAAASATWAITTTCTSNGSVNAMHDSMTPMTGLLALMGMMVNCFFGGVGVGFLNMYVFIILAIFISGLMVGRTPEFLGKKIEAREMKIAMIMALLHPLLILAGTAIATFVHTSDPEACAGWLANPGFHGFTEMLYEFTSASANNGSGFEGLGDNTPFWNISTGFVMLFARYLPIIGPVAIAGLLADKRHIPEGAGTLKPDTPTFGILLLLVIMIVAALSFLPALTLGPIAEYLTQMIQS